MHRSPAAIARASALAACAWLLPSLALATTSVPFELVNDHVFIEVMLDGTGPYHFVVDSGSPFGLLDTSVARGLGTNVRGHGTVGGVGDGAPDAGLATVRVARIGAIVFAKAQFVVTDLHTTISEAEGRPIDGVLGREVFERFATTFDYARRAIVFGADVPGLARAGATLVPMRISGGVPQIACRIATIVTTCNVDTGSRLAITIPAPFATTHPSIVPERISAVGVDGFGLGGPAFGRVGLLESVSFGGFVERDVVCDFSTQRHGAFANPQLGANIGGGLLRGFAVTFDYAHRRIAFERRTDFDRFETPDRSGLFLIGRGEAVRVLDVRPGTPAARADIAPDDRIVAVDDRGISRADLPAVRARLSADPATFVSLQIERHGVIRSLALELEDYLSGSGPPDRPSARATTALPPMRP